MYLVEIHPVNSIDIYDLFHINIVKYNTFLFSMRGMSSGTLNIKSIFCQFLFVLKCHLNEIFPLVSPGWLKAEFY